MDIKQLIQDLISPVMHKCLEYTIRGKGDLYFIDPNDNEEISAHYGATFAAAGYIIYGKTYDTNIYNIGLDLLKSILKRWGENSRLPAFHFDFNNFALCIVHDYIEDTKLQSEIRSVVLRTPDSKHDTVNWLPMRWFVNERRYQWSPVLKYKKNCDVCREKISTATNSDGSIEDRLPKGVSFNLQYDISTVALLQFLRNLNINLDLSKQFGFLISAVLPDGDINYQGRGCNQIFAWGPWIYILASSNREAELVSTKSYLLFDNRLSEMLSNNNLMLNHYKGSEKFLWWDYHYASVYIAHLLFWLVLSLRDLGKFIISPKQSMTSDSGFHSLSNRDAFISWFEGRKEYLAERGPSISAIWTRKSGTVFKGTFGPWRGLFGNTHSFEDVVILNYCGLVSIVKRNGSNLIYKIKNRLLPLHEFKTDLKKFPVFCPISLSRDNNKIIITWQFNRNMPVYFNIPVYSENFHAELIVDGINKKLHNVAQIRNQYGWNKIYQSEILYGNMWQLCLEI